MGLASGWSALYPMRRRQGGGTTVCETKSLQQLPRTYIFNKKVNIAHQLEDMLHACRPEPATRARKFPWLIRLARNLGNLGWLSSAWP